MDEKTASDAKKSARPGRDDRLKAALKANMARRKAQAKARAGSTAAERDKKGEGEHG